MRSHYAVCLFLAMSAHFFGLSPEAAQAQSTEIERIQQCDRDLCGIIQSPSQSGRALQCDLGVTWYKEELDKAAKSKSLTWPFGDARCSLKLDVERASLAGAVTEKIYKLKLTEHAATCEVENNGTRYPATVKLAPEIEFNAGNATSASLQVTDIEANVLVKGLIWSVAKLEANFGLFQKDLVIGLNAYLERCRSRPGGKRQVQLRSGTIDR